MRKMTTVTALTLALAPTAATAQERAAPAAIGAVSGALVLGPIGAVAGAVVGYAAGPEISRSLGAKRPLAGRRARKSSSRHAKRKAHVKKHRAAPTSAPVAMESKPEPAQAAEAPTPATGASLVPVPAQGLE